MTADGLTEPVGNASQRQSRASRAADLLSDLASKADAGGRLGTKTELRALCSVSVGTFNEALKLAEARGVIQLRPGPGGGLFAGQPSPMVRLGNSMLALDKDSTSVAEAVRLRDALDPLLVEDALTNATAEDLKLLREHLGDMEQGLLEDDSLAFIRANWRLHAVIAAASPHPMLKTLYLHLLDLIEMHTLDVQPAEGQPLPDFIAQRYELHVHLVDAIEAGDRTEALRLIREHNTTGVTSA